MYQDEHDRILHLSSGVCSASLARGGDTPVVCSLGEGLHHCTLFIALHCTALHCTAFQYRVYWTALFPSEAPVVRDNVHQSTGVHTEIHYH